MTNTVTSSNGITLAGGAAPRILPDLSQSVSTGTGTANPAKTAALKAKRMAAGDKPGEVAEKGVKAKHKANVIAASDKVRRISRVEPICKVIAAMMDKGPKHVAIMAKQAKCSERDIRLAIDKLRAMKWRIDRIQGAPKTFGYAPKFKRPKL